MLSVAQAYSAMLYVGADVMNLLARIRVVVQRGLESVLVLAVQVYAQVGLGQQHREKLLPDRDQSDDPKREEYADISECN